MKSRLQILLISIFLSVSTFAQQKTDNKILFIGNSLTYTNNLPEIIKDSAKSKGFKIEYKMIASPNYAIHDHWKEGKVQKLISSKKYDYVIIQQGPSSQSEGRNILLEYGKKYAELCKSNNAKLCFFMVWPSKKYYHTFDGVIKNYTEATSMTNSILLPVGQVWKEHFDKTEDYSYYGPDGFHPSLKGSSIAAKTIVKTLFSK